MSEQLQKHVCYHLKIGSRHQKVKFAVRHYKGVDKVCRKGLNVYEYKGAIQINNDSHFRFYYRHSLGSQTIFVK